MRWMMMLIATAGMAQADPVEQMAAAAGAAFARMPDVVVVDRIAGRCGADAAVHETVAYCTTSNEIFLAQAARNRPDAPYLLGHAYGHAVQVQHGVADAALRAIRRRPEDETMLRTFVELQVDCIAGALVERAGLGPLDLEDLFDADPFADIHWGRNPLRIGPQISVPLADRATWFAVGQSNGVVACAPGEFTSDLLIDALQD